MKIVLIAALTERSKAYAQILRFLGIRLSEVVIYGTDKTNLLGVNSEGLFPRGGVHASNLFVPDFKEALQETVVNANWSYSIIDESDVNSEKLLEKIRKISPDMIIFSGYGGQIVKGPLLEFPLVHIHSGWVPEFKGSMTLFYEILQDGECAASAFLLNDKIDEGKIIKRKKYVVPHDINLDYVFDSIVRADLLKEVVLSFIKDKKFSFEEIEDQENLFMPYYIMHPLLKHLTLLKIGYEHD